MLINMLGTRITGKDFIPTLVHAYNCTKSNITEYSPYCLMFRHKPRLPINLQFGVKMDQMTIKSICPYVKHLQEILDGVYKLAQQVQEREMQWHKICYDHKIQCIRLDPGDLVLVRHTTFQGKHKIVDRWENPVYEVLDKHKSLPVYKIKSQEGDGRTHMDHCNLLLLLVHL